VYALIIRRLVTLPILLIVVSLLAFLLPYLSGMDPATAILQARAAEREPSPEVLDRIRTELGLDRPLAIQYLGWLGRLVRGDLGFSYTNRAPIGEILSSGLKVTLILSVVSLLLAVVVAIPLGVLAAVRPGRWLDNVIAAASQTGVAIPEYWFAPVMILIFAIWLGWLPSSGWRGPQFLILPAVTLALRPIAYFTRLTRAAMIEVLGMDYIRAARAKGLTEFQTIWRHGLRNALIPVVTLVTLWLAGLLGGSVIVEVIFAIPGLGRVLFDAVIAGDIPLVQGGVVLIVGLAVIINTLTDFAYTLLNPSIQIDRPPN
jgi:peptide/nickel transport system permease protein